MKIGRYDLQDEADSVNDVLSDYNTRSLELAKSSAMANYPTQCWQFAKDSLIEFGCDTAQAAQLMSNVKDIRLLDLCTNLDPNVHVLRAYLGRCAYRARLRLHSGSISAQAEECIDSGIISIGPDELQITEKQRADIARELTSTKAIQSGIPIVRTPSASIDGTLAKTSESMGTLAKTPESMILDENGQARPGLSACHALLKAITPLLSEVSGISEKNIWNQLTSTAFVQKVVNSPEDNDVQKVLHQDTWHDAWKLWYFPNDVKSGEGPFRFAPYSHGLSSARLRLMKEFATQYRKWEEWRSYGHDEGSWRVSGDELQSMGAPPWPWRRRWPNPYELQLTEKQREGLAGENEAGPWLAGQYDIEASAGTLVLANVYGYHARGLAHKLHERIALHASIRINPWA